MGHQSHAGGQAEDADGEDFVGARCGEVRDHPRQHSRGDDQQGAQHPCGQGGLAGYARGGEVGCVNAQQDQQRDDRQVLKQQDRNAAQPMGGIDLPAVDEQLGYDCRRRHGNNSSDGNSRIPRAARQEHEKRQRHQQADADLAAADADHVAAQRAQLGDRELEAEHEHQAHDPQFGDFAYFVAVGAAEHGKALRPDEHADCYVADDRRQADAVQQQQGNQRPAEQDEQQDEQGKVGCHPARPPRRRPGWCRRLQPDGGCGRPPASRQAPLRRDRPRRCRARCVRGA